MAIAVRAADFTDLASWLEIVREVEPLFGDMPDFTEHAQRAIERGTALVAAERGRVLGGVLLSRDDRPHQIHWLAVRGTARRSGVGHALMEAILRRWPTGDIHVLTFGHDVADGEPARCFYESHGFDNEGPSEAGPDGGSRERYVRPQR